MASRQPVDFESQMAQNAPAYSQFSSMFIKLD
jgi:hypothetical protein